VRAVVPPQPARRRRSLQPTDARRVLRRAHTFAAKHNNPKLAEDLMELLSDVRTAMDEVERVTRRDREYLQRRAIELTNREVEVADAEALELILLEGLATVQRYVQLARGFHIEGMPDYEYKPPRESRSRHAA
jgi:hypothetical protein